MNRQADVTVVISAHDAGRGILATIESVASDAHVAAVHVVDSGSGDGTPELVRNECPDVRVTELGANRGPCATRNLGLAEAATRLVLFLDDDMVLERGALGRLADALEERRAAMAGPRIHATPDGGVPSGEDPGAVQYQGGSWHFAGLTHMHGQGGGSVTDASEDVDVLTSGCLLARVDALRDAGGFDENLFFLMEDVECCLRMRYLGHRLVVVPDARAWNAGGSRGLSLGGGDYPRQRMRLHARNRSLIVLALYDWSTLIVTAPALLMMDAAWGVFALLAGRPGAFLTGKVQALKALPAALARGRTLRGRKVLADRDLLGAPPLTLTETARAQPMVVALTRVLDASLRHLWNLMRCFLR